MYHEEELLYLAIHRAGMHTLYCPSLNIIHLEKKSTTSVNRNAVKRRKFICKNQLSSLNILIDEIKSGDKSEYTGPKKPPVR